MIDDAEKLLSKELYRLSLKEREDIINDVHGGLESSSKAVFKS
jgi:hypothetical protein